MTPYRSVGIFQLILGIAVLIFGILGNLGTMTHIDPRRAIAIDVVGIVIIILGVRTIRRTSPRDK